MPLLVFVIGSLPPSLNCKCTLFQLKCSLFLTRLLTIDSSSGNLRSKMYFLVQNEVLEKARRAKEQAAMEAKGLVPQAKSSADKASAVNGVASNTYSPAESVNSTTSALQSEPVDREDNPPSDG